jgi:DNA-binding NtrC family response regulator
MKTMPQPIFLVEDNEMYLKTLEKYLKEHLNSNTQVRTFLNGEDCLKNLNMKPKIVVLDYFLNSASPNAMNGLEVLKKIKITNPETSILMLSNQDNIQVATDIMKYGAFDYVSKSENAFLRVLNAIHNIDKIINQAAEIKMGRQVKRVLIAWIILLIAIMVILQLFFPQLMNRNN